MPLWRVPKQRHSAKYIFAECQKRHSVKTHFTECRKMALGKIHLCRVPKKTLGKAIFVECFFLLSVFYLALGKDHLYRVYDKIHSAKPSALSKEVFCRVHFCWPSANYFFKAIFEARNEFKWKTFQLQSCITSQDLQSLFGHFFIWQSDNNVVHKIYISLISLILVS